MMNRFKRAIALLMTAVMITSSISGTAEAASKKKAVKSVGITNVEFGTVVLKPKKTFKLKTKVTVTGKASKKVTYSSSKKKVATVSKSGKIKALKKGKTKITVKSKADKKKKAVVTVIVGTPVAKVTLDKQKADLTEGDTLVLNAVLSPKKPNVKKIKWSSDTPDVAEVSASGVVSAKKEGTAVITAKAMDNSHKKAVCKVTVTKKSTSDNPTTEKVTTEKPTTEKPTTEKPTTGEPTTEEPTTDQPTVPVKGYELKWKDDFEGTELNQDDWNVELHAPGWVNAELQKYVDSKDNIYVEDGNLVIKPIKTGEGKEATYTSGRVNTQGKHDFTYGLFEARVKVPTGKGYLPAFWMMPTNENLYGQWPKCGEIDIMEVMGQENDKVYGTIHYGAPHAESQGTQKLTKGNFSDEYHVFSCEWEPGSIKWYVDGVLYHEENDWFSAAEGQGTVSYPAPFDQPFYMILNLAVGGSWVGYPDETTDFADQAFVIDYVKAYQKTEGYDDSKVTKPEKPPVILRDPDESGNYVNNADFSTKEDLEDDVDWSFATALGGEATAEIVNDTKIGGSAIKIATTNEGTVDYSVQLLENKVPLKQGNKYKLTFDAYAEEPRTMFAGVGAIGDRSWKKYVNSEINLTTEKQEFSCEFAMSDADYADARIEFNMGKVKPTATIYISNVRLEVIDTFEVDDSKTVRADGNYIYNGSFQEGADRMEFWEVEDAGKKATVGVTDLKDGRRFKAVTEKCSSADEVWLKQTELPLTPGKFELSFDAELKEPAAGESADLKVHVAGKTETFTLKKDEKKTHTYKFEIAEDAVIADIDDIVFDLGVNGTVLLDNVRLVEDTLIKNGSFNAGTAGYEIYVDAQNGASASYVVDSQTEKNVALDLTIKNGGENTWDIQVKQSNVKLEKDKCYELKFDIKSAIDRSIQYSIQRDGSVHKTEAGGEDWTPYVQKDIDLTAYGEDGAYTTVSEKFRMDFDTDEGSIFNIALGGKEIKEQHRVCIDNISLVEIPESEMPVIPSVKPGVEMLKNPDFAKGAENWEPVVAAPGAATTDFKNNKATFNISNVGTKDSDVQLKQDGITLETGEKYKVSFKVTSDKARTIKLGFLDPKHGWDWYGGKDIALTADEEKTVEHEFTVGEDKKTRDTIIMVVSMGKIEGEDTPVSTITMSDFSLKKVEEQTEEPDEPVKLGEEMLKNPNFADGDEAWETYIATDEGAAAVPTFEDGKAKFTISKVGTKESHVQLKQEGITLEKGKTYQVSFKAKSDTERTIKLAFCDPDSEWKWYGGEDSIVLTAGDVKNVKCSIPVSENTSSSISLLVSMGKLNEDTPDVSVIELSDFSLKEVLEGSETPVIPVPAGENMLKNADFSDVANSMEGWTETIANWDDLTAAATRTIQEGVITYAITDVGTEDWHVQLKQSVSLKKDKTYKVEFTISSTVARTVKSGVMSKAYDWYGGGNYPLEANEEQKIEYEVTLPKDDATAEFFISMGQMFTDVGEKIDTPASTITISGIKLTEVVK
ncbi:MAG: carbohydrate binding domain-containing protein [Lachnospiraceae bacterium]|nr:carbohydrate binding domain-containing protein [Lachnospiraceae bacterium]